MTLVQVPLLIALLVLRSTRGIGKTVETASDDDKD
jgi:hypothetical protein